MDSDLGQEQPPIISFVGPKVKQTRGSPSYAASPSTSSYELWVAESVNVLNDLQKMKFDQMYVRSIPVLNKLPSQRRVDSISDSPPAINFCKAEGPWQSL